MADRTNLHSPLHEKHVALEAKFSDISGWDMPLSYGNPLAEASEVRERAGVCDISHTGRFVLRGDGALDLLERVCTADVIHQEDETALYTLLCNEKGGIVADARVHRMQDGWVITCEPTLRAKLGEYLRSAAEDVDACKVIDRTEDTCTLEVAGPAAPELLDQVLPVKVSGMQLNEITTGSLLLAKYHLARYGTVGGWGLQASFPRMFSGKAWEFITRKAGENAILPYAHAARDVLRVEAGVPAYGHELNEMIDPISAGLAEAVDFTHDFLGAEALKRIVDNKPSRRLVGLKVEPTPEEPEDSAPPIPVIPRMGDTVLTADGREIGSITSGTYSPMAKSIVAMAYVAREASADGEQLSIRTAAAPLSASVATLAV